MSNSAPLKYEVYRIDKLPARGNTHGVNREEVWSICLDAVFSSQDEARDHVIRMNRKHCGYELGILYSTDQGVIAQRCSDLEWCHLQRYFMGRPNVDLITEKLRKDRITVFRSSKL